MNIAIVSNKFSAAHLQHMYAYKYAFESLGNDCKFILDKNYKKAINTDEQNCYLLNDDAMLNHLSFDYALIYNISSIDSSIIKKMKKVNQNIKIILVLHEPWAGNKCVLGNLLKKREPLKETIKAYVRKLCFELIKNKLHSIIFCSKNAMNIFEKNNKFNGKRYIIPLMLNDNCYDCFSDDRKYFSYIGSITKAHNFQKYLEFVKKYGDSGIVFRIYTSQNIDSYLEDSALQKLVNEDKLIVSSGRYLSDAEITKAYFDSFAVWLVYERTTQSSVLCKSFMCGTPVVCLNKGSFGEFVSPDTGLLLNVYSENDIFEGLKHIQNNVEQMSKQCRLNFYSFFDWKNKKECIKKILEE